MIRATIYTKDKKVTGFEINGHACFGEYGKDIVCAAASAVVYTAMGTLDEMGIKPVYTEKEGRMSFDLSNDLEDGQLEKAHIVLETVKIGLLQIQNGYKQHIKVKIREV
jgi:uncharacterized protein YsxB (DUF464 family)